MYGMAVSVSALRVYIKQMTKRIGCKRNGLISCMMMTTRDAREECDCAFCFGCVSRAYEIVGLQFYRRKKCNVTLFSLFLSRKVTATCNHYQIIKLSELKILTHFCGLHISFFLRTSIF